jgi:hypothetical protein
VARPRIVWSNAQLRLIMSGIERFDREFPTDNARFLDAVIDEVRMVTGKLYGSGTYARLLRDTGDMTRVTRRPGTATIQKAIERAQALKPSLVSAGDDSGEAPSFDVHSLRRAIEPVVRDTLVPLHALLAQLVNAKPVAGEGATVAVSGEQAVQLQLARASLEDAHSRIRRLEEESLFRISSGCTAGSSAGASPAKRTLDACRGSKLMQGWLRQNAAISPARLSEL